MTIPELLEAREKIRQRLREGTGGQQFVGYGVNRSAFDELMVILREIEAELADQGYKDAQKS